ncbi:MAG: hypothetical protein AAFR84_21210, partial [Pseudomonadota bacterium]
APRLMPAAFFAHEGQKLFGALRLVRGPINMVLGLPKDVNTPQGAEELLTFMREEGGGHETWGVSRRRDKPLTDSEIEQIKAAS